MTLRTPLTLVALCFMSTIVNAQSVGGISTTIEAEHASATQGVALEPIQDKNPRIGVMHCGVGDWIRWDSVGFFAGEFDSATLHYWTQWPQENGSAVVRLRIDSPTGAIVASFNRLGEQRAVQGEPSAHRTSALARTTGVHALYLTFEGSADICDIDKVRLSGSMTASAQDVRTYYVATTGSDDSSGLTLAGAFRTIQRAASVMKPGSRCLIRQGVYRETVRPLYTGLSGASLSFEAYNGENVVISGADVITGWAPHTGSIYKAPMPRSIGEYNDQVLVDGKMAWVARYPNVDADYQPEPIGSPWCGSGLFNWKKWQTLADPIAFPTCVGMGDNGSHGINLPAGYSFDMNVSQPPDWTDPNRRYQVPSGLLGQPDGFLAGGLITIRSMWWSSFGHITSSRSASSTNSVIIANLVGGGIDAIGPGFVSHVFALLDAPNEWFRRDSTLYLWVPDGGDPSHHVVEAKRRTLGFDLSNKQYVNISGIRFLATSMTLNEASHCAIDRCHFRYVSHFDTCGWWETLAYWRAPFDPTSGYSGIWVSGNNNRIQNSSIVGSAGSGVILSGEHNVVTNCIIHSCDYLATYQAGILVYKRDITDNTQARGLTISHNTLKYNSRFNVEVKAASSTPQDRVLIEYNDFGPAAYALKESASLSGQARAVEVSHNYFHGVGLIDGGDILPESDMGGGAWVIHHNVFWQGETPNAPLLTGSHWCLGGGDTTANGDGILFNNTVIDSCMPATRDRDTGLAVWYLDNNTIYARSDTVLWKFTDPNNRDYSLRQGSPAIDAGRVIPGYVETYRGTAPDLGAYESGQTPWKAGTDWQEAPWVYPPPTNAAIRGMKSPRSGPAYASRLRVLPGRIEVSGLLGTSWALTLFDLKGATVASVKGGCRDRAAVDMRGTAAGSYVVRLSNAGRSSVTWRVIIR